MTGSHRRVRRIGTALGLVAGAFLSGAWAAPGAARIPQESRPLETPPVALGDDRAVDRRDPFQPLPVQAAEPRRAETRTRGLAGLRVGDVEVVGIVAAPDARFAVLEAPDGRTYVARVNDRLADGIVREVVRGAVLFTVAQADGQAGAVPGREMRKALGQRPGEP